jgi:exopolysaccharide biosynthesis WecB/TagA/CpsF family protein
MRTDRVDFLGVAFDRLGFEQVIEALRGTDARSPFAYLVTPNVDHVVRLNAAGDTSDLRHIYDDADLCLCDSRILSRIARLHHLHLPVVPGSDLTARLLRDVVNPGDRIAVVGGDDALISALASRFTGVKFVHHAPPMGMRDKPAAIASAAEWIAASGARFILIAVGSPQGEMLAAAVRRFPAATGMALSIGASLDFITGRQTRAPRWMQQLSLEWAHRLLSDPRRMWRRYLVEGPRIFLLAARYRRQAGVP